MSLMKESLYNRDFSIGDHNFYVFFFFLNIVKSVIVVA